MSSERDEKKAITAELRTDVVTTIPRLQRRPVLTSLKGELLAAPIPLERDVVTIGRALEADIRLNDFKASRLHAQVRAERLKGSQVTQFRVKDLGSTNGTLV